jgi:hypothetical protein
VWLSSVSLSAVRWSKSSCVAKEKASLAARQRKGKKGKRRPVQPPTPTRIMSCGGAASAALQRVTTGVVDPTCSGWGIYLFAAGRSVVHVFVSFVKERLPLALATYDAMQSPPGREQCPVTMMDLDYYSVVTKRISSTPPYLSLLLSVRLAMHARSQSYASCRQMHTCFSLHMLLRLCLTGEE